MFDLFVIGGPIFMGAITIILFAGLVVSTRALLAILNEKEINHNTSTHQMLDAVRSIGLLALVTGVLGQMIGLYSAFSAIQEMGSVAPELLAGGLRVSSITTIWGMICFVICYLIYLGLSAMVKHNK